MDHVAIDLGGRESQVCIRRPNNDVHLERRIPTAKLKAFFKTLEPSRVILETCALTPGEHSNSDTKRRTGLTKAGSAAVRWLLVQAAWTALRTRPNDPMVLWARRMTVHARRSPP